MELVLGAYIGGVCGSFIGLHILKMLRPDIVTDNINMFLAAFVWPYTIYVLYRDYM